MKDDPELKFYFLFYKKIINDQQNQEQAHIFIILLKVK